MHSLQIALSTLREIIHECQLTSRRTQQQPTGTRWDGDALMPLRWAVATEVPGTVSC